jgi:hypothetical protein
VEGRDKRAERRENARKAVTNALGFATSAWNTVEERRFNAA